MRHALPRQYNNLTYRGSLYSFFYKCFVPYIFDNPEHIFTSPYLTFNDLPSPLPLYKSVDCGLRCVCGIQKV